MADNFDNPQLGNFSIQDTMEMGSGNQELLQGLFAPETSTTDPNDLENIDDTKKTPAPAKKVAAAKTTQDTDNGDEDSKPDDKQSLTDFLLGGGGEDEEEEDDEAPKKTVTKDSKQENVDDEEENDEADDDSQSSDSPFKSLSKDLLKLGVFTQNSDEEEDEEITTPEQFLERFKAEQKKGAIEMVDNFLGQHGEDYKNAFDAIFVKGVHPKDYFGAFDAIQDFNDLDLTQESNQISVIKQALTDQGFDPEDITTEIDRLKNYGDLESVAAKHHKVLVKKQVIKLQQLEQQQEQKLKEQAAYKQQYAANINNVLQSKLKTKEFDGIPLNPKLAGELQDFLVTDKYKTPSGETLTDFDKTILELKRPENHERKVKVALLLKILEKDPTLSTIQKTGITKKSNDLFSEVARQAAKSSTKSSRPVAKPTSWFQ
jgi:hypothetical protein